MIRFFSFAKGWIARTLPELMPKGSLQRCRDLNFSIEGGLTCCREFQELKTPSGVSSATQKIKSFFQHTSGGTISTFILKGNDLYLDLNNAGFNSLVSVSATTYNYTTSFTENDTTGSSITIYTNNSGCTIDTVFGETHSTDVALYRQEQNFGDFTYKLDIKGSSVVASGSSSGYFYLWGVSDGYGIARGYSVDKITLAWTIANEAGDFVALSQTTRNWWGLAVNSNDDVYAGVYNGDIYKQTASAGDFVALSQTSRNWYALAVNSNNDVYACVTSDDIYKQTAGVGDFVALEQTTRSWRGLAVKSNNDVYACVSGGDIYKQTAGVGDFVSLSQTSRSWVGLAVNSNDDVYACVYGGDIYKQTAGAGDFVALSQTSRSWRSLGVNSNDDVYACVYNGDIYKQTAGAGDFVALSQTSRGWRGLAVNSNNDVYVGANSGDIYKKPSGGSNLVLAQTNGVTSYVSDTFSGVTLGSRRYYLEIKKDSSVGSYGRVTCEVYNEQARSNLLDTLSIDLTKSFSTSHLFAFSTDGLVGDDAWSGEVRNLVKTSGQVSADEDYAIYKVMTPSVSTKPIVYIATSNRLLRSGGETKYVSGSSWVQVGVPAPSGMSTCKIAAGSLTGTYQLAYTYFDSEVGAESEPSSTSTLILSSNNVKYKWQTAPAYTGHANKVKLYRSIANGGTLFHDCTVTISRSATTQAYTSSLADSALGLPIGDVGQPPKGGSLIEAWKGRLWISGISQFQGENAYNRVYYSRNLNPETVPPDYYLAIANTEAIVKGFAIFEGRLFVLTESGVYEVEGSTSDSFKLSDSLSPVGPVSGDSIAVGRGGIYFVALDGVYKFQYKLEDISDTIAWVFKHSGDSWHTKLPQTSITQAKGWYYDGLYYVSIGNTTLIYEEATGRWRERTNEFTCGWNDPITSRMYAGVSTPGYYMIGHLINDNTSGVTGLVAPDFITHPVYTTPVAEDNPIPRVNRVGKYKVNALGYWRFYFYCDDTLVHTTTGTTFTGTSRNVVFNLPSDIKGTTLYVRGVACGTPTPTSTRFYSMEVW